MQYDAGAVVSRGQVNRGHRAYALSVQDNVGRADTVSDAQRVPGGLYVRVEVFLGGLAGAGAVARIVIGEYVALETTAEAVVEAAHLAEIDRVAVTEQYRILWRRRASHIETGYLMAAIGAREKHFELFELRRAVLPLGLVHHDYFGVHVRLLLGV